MHLTEGIPNRLLAPTRCWCALTLSCGPRGSASWIWWLRWKGMSGDLTSCPLACCCPAGQVSIVIRGGGRPLRSMYRTMSTKTVACAFLSIIASLYLIYLPQDDSAVPQSLVIILSISNPVLSPLPFAAAAPRPSSAAYVITTSPAIPSVIVSLIATGLHDAAACPANPCR